MIKLTKRELESLYRTHKKILKTGKTEENAIKIWYKFRNPMAQGTRYFFVLICKPLPPCRLKNSIYRFIGMRIGKNVAIGNDCILDPIFPELIVIEDDVSLGWGVKIYTHEYLKNSYRIGSVIIKKDALIGEWSLVRPGITVGKNATVGAMSFVNKDVRANDVVGGVPAKSIKHKVKR